MDDNSSKCLKKALLIIAKEIKRVCDNHGINYFLDYGTLIGAIRHQGFIPWDDDLDIGMLRDEYERFLQVAERELDDSFFLDNFRTNPDCPIVFTKVRLKGTRCLEKKGNPNLVHNEIAVDVVPYYYISDKKHVRKYEGMKLAALSQSIMSKSGCKAWMGDGFKKRLKFIPTDIIGRILSKKRMHKMINKTFVKHEGTSCISPNIGFGYDRFIYPVDLFKEYTDVCFEGETYKTIKGYDEYLTMIYGDYMKYPPESERNGRHSLYDIDFGEYGCMGGDE